MTNKNHSGSSLTVVRIKKLNNSFKTFISNKEISIEKKIFEVSLQKDLTLFIPNSIKYEKTKIEKLKSSKSGNYYNVKLLLNNKNETIFIRDSRIENGFGFFEEFRKQVSFEIFINNLDNLIYIYTNKDNSKFFLNLLIKEKVFEIEKINFDFKKLSNLIIMKEAWGIWYDGRGDIRKTANFGINLIDSIKNFNLITTIYLDCNYKTKQMTKEEDEIIQVILSKEGSISTKSKFITDDEMFNLFNKIYEVIGE